VSWIAPRSDDAQEGEGNQVVLIIASAETARDKMMLTAVVGGPIGNTVVVGHGFS